MLADKTTQTDLSIFHPDIEQSVFHHLNFTKTNAGREVLRELLCQPLRTLTAIENTQQTIRQLGEVIDQWPVSISNGTLMVLEKFYDTPIDKLPKNPGFIGGWYYRITSPTDYSITKYTIEHAIDFTNGMVNILLLIKDAESGFLKTWYEQIKKLLQREEISQLLSANKKHLTLEDVFYFGNFIRDKYKNSVLEMMDIYFRMDAFMSMAIAGKKWGLSFPVITESDEPILEARGLFHILLPVPVPYDVRMNKSENFIFLTGANMAGKSTFIKAVGISAYLAHIGMGVPASEMKISLLDGILSNIQITDNLIRGESFFYNEVQRIKSTIEKIITGKKWLILIDELFKGTNQEDAVRCSAAVMEGLRKNENCMFIISTHLYEIGESLKKHSTIQFHYFETSISEGELCFSYHLKPGISNDRLGYLILLKEGVLDLLNKL
jgi:DNA mismatch repair protein MutS